MCLQSPNHSNCIRKNSITLLISVACGRVHHLNQTVLIAVSSFALLLCFQCWAGFDLLFSASMGSLLDRIDNDVEPHTESCSVVNP